MKVWNFETQEIEEGVIPPICNGVDGKYYEPVSISYNKDGKTSIQYIKDKEDEPK